MWNDALSFAMVIILVSLSTLLILFSATRKEKAYWIFSAGYVSGMISFMLFPAQGRMSPWIGIVAANIILMFFHFSMAWGIRVFYSYGRPWPIRFSVYYLLFAVALIFLTFKYPAFNYRGLMFSLYVILLTAEFMAVIGRGMRDFPRAMRYTIFFFISFAIILHGIRIVLLFLPMGKVSLFMDVNPVTTFTFAATILIAILWAGSLLIIDDIRLMNDMRTKNAILENLAMKDELTGVFNRHYLDQTMHTEMERQDRYLMPLSIIMMDIDHFKSVNDNFGHDVGDTVLMDTARLVNRGIRETDILFRWGGEEFFIIMPHTDITGAALLAEKLRKAIEGNNFPHVGKVTASFGVAERKKSEHRYDLFRRIDQALYRAKNSGRNKVEIQKEYAVSSASVRIEWNKDWECGNKMIDSAHKALIQMGNELINLSISHTPNDIIIDKLDLLIEHIKNHFTEEEQILTKSGFPDVEEHAKIHSNLISEALIFRDKFSTGECTSSLVFNFIVNRIIVDHLLTTDTQFFPYLKTR